QDALAAADAVAGASMVLDPWNGSGTTTEVAAQQGFDIYGFDLNPVMVIVAKARTLQPDVGTSLRSLFAEILLRAETIEAQLQDDPLLNWFSEDSARSIRQIEMATQIVLIDSTKYQRLGTARSLTVVSPLAAFFYVALFRAIRSTLRAFRTSNPTWIKRAATPGERIDIPRAKLRELVRDLVESMC